MVLPISQFRIPRSQWISPIRRPYVALCSLFRTGGAKWLLLCIHPNPSTPALPLRPPCGLLLPHLMPAPLRRPSHAACVKKGLVTRRMALWMRLLSGRGYI